jgi:hypothetical protein
MLILVVAMACCFAIMAGNSNSVLADDAVELDILRKVKRIRIILNRQVIPKLDECCAGAGVAKTGQTTSYATGDDGDLQMGTAWPVPRFTDNADGTVTDNLTGLIWLKNANCFGQNLWAAALSFCNVLEDGQCGLTDGSSLGDWRLPNVRELHSLIDYSQYVPALPNTEGTGQWAEGDPFTNVQSYYYWSSTAYEGGSTLAWGVYMVSGYVGGTSKANDFDVWPVRAGN